MTEATTKPILYSFRRCPYAIRARMALRYSQVQCELREVVLKDKPPELLLVSDKGTVPVLVLDRQVLDESLDIMRWALESNDPKNWQADLLSHPLVVRNDDYFKFYLDRYKYFDRYPQAPQLSYKDQALVFLNELESALQPNSVGQYFLYSSRLTALDAAIFPFVRQFAFVDKPAFDALTLPKLRAWLEWFLKSDLFLSVMHKYPPWSKSQAAVVTF